MLSFVCLSILLGFGYWLRRKLVFLQRLYLPASVSAGLLGLILLNTHFQSLETARQAGAVCRAF